MARGEAAAHNATRCRPRAKLAAAGVVLLIGAVVVQVANGDAVTTLSLPGRHSLAEPEVAVNPVDPSQIAVGAQMQDEAAPAHPVLSFVSSDGGHSFARTNVSGGGLGDVHRCGFDPVVDYGNSGQLLYAHLFGGPVRHGRHGYPDGFEVDRSLDGGHSFSRSILAEATHASFPAVPSCYPGTVPFPFADKPWIGVQRSGASSGRVYAVWARFSSETRSAIIERHSDDGGVTFSPRRTLDSGRVGDPQVAVRPDGTAVALWVRHERHNPDQLQIRGAAGVGGQFGAPKTLAKALNSSFGAGYDTIPSLAADATGNVAACWQQMANVSRRHPSIAAFCMRSADGNTWSSPYEVAAPAKRHQQALAVVAGGAAGRFYLLFYDGKPGRPFDVRLLVSRDGGVSFAPSASLESVRIESDAFWLGDYVGLAASPSGAVAAYTVPRGRGLRSIRVRAMTVP